MRIIERQLGDMAVLDLHGALTGPAGAALLDAAIGRLSEAGPQTVVIDLEHVPSMDAAGLGALVNAYNVMRSHNGTMRLAHVTPRIHHLIAISRLVTVFESSDSVDDTVPTRGSEPSTQLAPNSAIGNSPLAGRPARRRGSPVASHWSPQHSISVGQSSAPCGQLHAAAVCPEDTG